MPSIESRGLFPFRSALSASLSLLLGVGSLCGPFGMPAEAAGAEVRIAPFAGAISLDSHLSDFRWDVTPQPVFGVSTAARLGRHAAGVRVWRSSTTQSTGVPGDELLPTVRLTGSEAFGEFGVTELAGVQFLALGSIGLLHLGYSPDRLSLDIGTSQPLEVDLDPITETTAGLGIALRRSVVGRLELGARVSRSWFRLDTTHRVGTEIIEDRETFGQWSAYLELSHGILHL